MTLYHPTQRRPMNKFGGLGDTTCPDGYAVYAGTGQCTQLPSYRLEKTLNDYLLAASLGQYGDPPPSASQMASMLAGEVAIICSQSLFPCDASVSALVDSYVAAYSQWLATYVPGSLVYAQTQPPTTTNTLNNVAPSGPSITPSLIINNASGGSNSQFRVGDTIRVVITGPPNSPVSLLGTKNNVQFPQTQVGTTDAYGNYVFSAVLTADSIGAWIENWYVGNTRVNTITFSVVQASALNPPQGTDANVSPGTITNNQSPPPTAGGTTQNTTVVNGASASDQAITWLKDNWVLVAAGLGAVIILPSILKN